MHKAVLQGAAAVECAAVGNGFTLTAMRSEQFGAVHFVHTAHGQSTSNGHGNVRFVFYVSRPFRKSMKGGLCDRNVFPQSVRVCGIRFQLTHAYFCIGVLKIWR